MARFMTSGFSASNLGSQPRCLRKSPQADEHGRPNQEPLESAMTVKDLAGLWLSSEPLKRTDPRQERGVCEPESDGGPPQTRPRKAPWFARSTRLTGRKLGCRPLQTMIDLTISARQAGHKDA
jgi:hypothetical protein